MDLSTWAVVAAVIAIGLTIVLILGQIEKEVRQIRVLMEHELRGKHQHED